MSPPRLALTEFIQVIIIARKKILMNLSNNFKYIFKYYMHA
jgi:hypothetical protein